VSGKGGIMRMLSKKGRNEAGANARSEPGATATEMLPGIGGV